MTVLTLIGRKTFRQVENTVGKGEIPCFEQFLLFPEYFQRLLLQTCEYQGLFENGLSKYAVCQRTGLFYDSVCLQDKMALLNSEFHDDLVGISDQIDALFYIKQMLYSRLNRCFILSQIDVLFYLLQERSSNEPHLF